MKTVILAAGFGSRLWPLSTSEKPKQFQPLLDGQSLLQYTYKLLGKVVPQEDLYVLTLDSLEPQVFEQLPLLPKSHVVLVPARRDTLAHTLFAVNDLAEGDGEPIFFSSVDLFMKDPQAFLKSLKLALNKFADGQISETTLCCLKSTKYNPNGGYAQIDRAGKVAKFVEKPQKGVWQKLATGDVWYESIFQYVTSRAALAAGLKNLKPALAEPAHKLLTGPRGLAGTQYMKTPVADLSSTLFQQADNLRVVALDSDFVDVGRFSALYELGEKDAHGNVITGQAIVDEVSTGNFIFNQLDRPLVVAHMKDAVIVQAEAGTLAAPMRDVDAIKVLYKKHLVI